MTNIRKVWESAEKHVAKHQRHHVGRLRQFLRESKNLHARALSGRRTESDPDENSVRELEVSILEQCKGSRSELSAWLSLCYAAISEYNRQGHHLPVNDLSPFIAPACSPFAPDAIALGHAVPRWREKLHDWIRNQSADASRQSWQAATLLSAILHGALLDSTKIRKLLEYLTEYRPPAVAGPYANYTFNLPYQGLGDYHLQRWVLDPVTELLVWRQPVDGDPITEAQITSGIREILGETLPKKSGQQNLTEVIRGATAWWSMRTAQIDIQTSSRRLISHGFHPTTWRRLTATQKVPGSSKDYRPRDQPRASGDPSSLSEELRLPHPWFAEVSDLLEENDIEHVIAACSDLRTKYAQQPSAQTYLGFLLSLLSERNSAGNDSKFSTAKGRFLATVSQLLGSLGDADPASLNLEQLEETYSEVSSDRDPSIPIVHLNNGLRDFHAYLRHHFKKGAIRNEEEVLGSEGSLRPVDASLISVDDYLQVQQQLTPEDPLPNVDHEARTCRLVCMFAFRCGLRRMEIFGLRLEDIQLGRWPHLIIRPHKLRGLKTPNSKRVIPLRLFLSPAEMRALREWVAQRRSEVAELSTDSQAFLFREFGSLSHETWINRIYKRIREEIRAATGDDDLYLHHLRHAFGTWNYMRLRVPELPMVLKQFERPDKGLDATIAFLKTGIRARRFLLGPISGPARGYAYAVARLLGHSSPSVSMGHYVHAADLFLGAIAWRESSTVPKAVYEAISCHKKTANYAYLKSESIDDHVNGCIEILEANRKKSAKAGPYVTSLLLGKSQSTRGRPPKIITPSDCETWVSFATCRNILEHAIHGTEPHEVLAQRFEFPPSDFAAALSLAAEWGSRICVADKEEKRLLSLPSAPKTDQEIAFTKIQEERLYMLSMTDPELLIQGVTIHLRYFNISKKDVLFNGKHHQKDLQTYIRFIKSLNVPKSDLEWQLRTENDPPEYPAWSQPLIKKLHVENFRNLGSPSAKKRPLSYSDTIGILFLSPGGKRIGQFAAICAFLTLIGLALKHQALAVIDRDSITPEK